jgi:sulfur-oxidizing protein SoxZ
MANWPVRIVMPQNAMRGDVIEIRSIIQHVMEPGYRRDDMGAPVPRDIIKQVRVTYAGAEVFRVEMDPGIAANPYFAFTTIAVETGDFVFTWTDEKGDTTTATRRLTVVG